MWFTWLPYSRTVLPAESAESAEAPVVLPTLDTEATLREALAGLSRAALEDAWWCTEDELVANAPRARRTALVQMRALILDEVEGRSPRRYRKWLRTSGPHRGQARTPSVILG